jgi:flagellin
MTSVLTNPGALVALESLDRTNNALTETQNQISTGLKISSAKDDAAIWTVATTMNANISSLNQTNTGLGNANSLLGTAVSGATQVASLVSQIRAQVASLTDPTTNAAATASNIQQLANQIQSTIASSSFNGVNLLNADSATGSTFLAATNNDYTQTAQATSTTITTGALVNLGSTNTPANATVTAFNTLMTFLSGAGAATISATAGTAATSGEAAIATYGGTNATASSLDGALNAIDGYAATVKSSASALGSVQSEVESQETFVTNLTTNLTTGVGNMIDADMTAESAQLTALQTQQQLGVSALSIANQAPAAILKLFG